MPIKKGTPKKGGRAKGTVNKKTAQLQASLELVMTALESTILDDLEKVNASRRLQLYTDLMNYVKPKLSATKNENDNKLSGGFDVNISFDLNNLNDGTDDK